MVSVPFAGQTYTDRSNNANAQRSVNLYPMKSPTPENPDRIIMYPTPGYSAMQDTTALGINGAGAIRGLFEINGDIYMISGSVLIKAAYNGTAYVYTSAGSLLTNKGRCSITCNTVELAISDGIYGYVYNLTSGAFNQISGGSFPANGVTNFTYQDAYVLAAVNGSKQIIQSELLSAGVYDAQAFASVTSYADDVAAIFSDQTQLYVFGPKLTEVRFNAADIPFAFEKRQGVLIQAGCAAKDTIVNVGNSLLWLASDGAGKAYVAALAGYATKVLSTAPINEAIERYSKVSDAFAYTYREADNQFYILTFPSANNGAGATWGYDVKLAMWHERSVAGGRDLPDQYVTANGMHIVGDATGKLYTMSQDYYLDGSGNGLIRIRTCQHLGTGKTLFLHELTIDIENGVGLLSGQGSDPLATLEISRDGGNTWLNVGTASMGKMGEYATRLTWRRLGRSRNTLTFRLTITDPVATYIIGADATITQGSK